MAQHHALTRLWHSKNVWQARQLVSPRAWMQYAHGVRCRLPDFIIAGAQKAGTTSLFGYLQDHPQCVPSSPKEVHYFDRHYHRGASWYRTLFQHLVTEAASAGAMQAFESSPYYMFEPRVPQRVRALLPQVKLIFLLREPVSRAFSHYHNNVRMLREPLSFEDAVAAEPARLVGEEQRLLANPAATSLSHQHYSYLGRGVYADQLARWREHFPARQMLVLEAEQFFDHPRDVFANVLEFLGLDSWEPASFGTLNGGNYAARIAPATRQRLAAYFAPHNARLYQLLGWRTSWELQRAA